MAITKIHAIKGTLGKSIKYIGNDLKTEGGKYVSTFGCAYETAELEFELTAQRARYDCRKNLAYHLIQSFKPGEVTPEQCHEIGKKFADEVLGGKYEYVLATHTDCGHLHNHIIFNAVSFKDRKRYRSDKRSCYRIREISDKICAEYGLNVIEENNCYSRYERKKTYISNKSRIRKAIDECILFAVNYEDFLQRMRRKNYDIREDEYLWFKESDNKRFTKTDTIGTAYRWDNIQKRIIGAYRPTTVDLMIDIEHNIKCQQSKGYEQWAKIYNLKLAAKTLNIIQQHGWSYEDLKNEVSGRDDKLKTVQDKIKSDKNRINEIDKILKSMNTYHRLKPIYAEYTNKNPLTKNGYYNKHKQEIDLFTKAANELKPHRTADNKLPNPKRLETEKKKLQADISKLTEQFKIVKTEYEDVAALKKNIDMFLGKSPELEQLKPQKKPSILAKLKRAKDRDEQDKQQKQREYNPEI